MINHYLNLKLLRFSFCVGLGKELVPIRRQAITWTNADQTQRTHDAVITSLLRQIDAATSLLRHVSARSPWRHMPSLDHKELSEGASLVKTTIFLKKMSQWDYCNLGMTAMAVSDTWRIIWINYVCDLSHKPFNVGIDMGWHDFWRYMVIKLSELTRVTLNYGGYLWCERFTKAPFISFPVKEIFAKTLVRFFESHSYLTGVAAAELLRRHLSNMNVIFTM